MIEQERNCYFSICFNSPHILGVLHGAALEVLQGGLPLRLQPNAAVIYLLGSQPAEEANAWISWEAATLQVCSA